AGRPPLPQPPRARGGSRTVVVGAAPSLKHAPRQIQPVDESLVADDVQLAVAVGAEGDDVAGAFSDFADSHELAVLLFETPHAARFVIAEDVNAVEARALVAAIDAA